MYVISFLDGVFPGVVLFSGHFSESKAREQQSRKDAGSNQQQQQVRFVFFWDAPILFDVFPLFTCLLYFSSLACSDFGYFFFHNGNGV